MISVYVSKVLLISSATVIVRAGGAILVCLLLCKEEGSSPVSLQLLSMYEVHLFMPLLGFRMETMLHMCGIMLFLR